MIWKASQLKTNRCIHGTLLYWTYFNSKARKWGPMKNESGHSWQDPCLLKHIKDCINWTNWIVLALEMDLQREMCMTKLVVGVLGLRHYKNTYETAQAETGQRQCGNQWPKSMRCAKNTGCQRELFKRFSCPEVAVWQWDVPFSSICSSARVSCRPSRAWPWAQQSSTCRMFVTRRGTDVSPEVKQMLVWANFSLWPRAIVPAAPDWTFLVRQVHRVPQVQGYHRSDLQLRW